MAHLYVKVFLNGSSEHGVNISLMYLNVVENALPYIWICFKIGSAWLGHIRWLKLLGNPNEVSQGCIEIDVEVVLVLF